MSDPAKANGTDGQEGIEQVILAGGSLAQCSSVATRVSKRALDCTLGWLSESESQNTVTLQQYLRFNS